MKFTFSVGYYYLLFFLLLLCCCLYFCDLVRKSFQNTIIKFSSVSLLFWSLMIFILNWGSWSIFSSVLYMVWSYWSFCIWISYYLSTISCRFHSSSIELQCYYFWSLAHVCKGYFWVFSCVSVFLYTMVFRYVGTGFFFNMLSLGSYSVL